MADAGKHRHRRFIPAHAGNAGRARSPSARPPVHPRACGERMGKILTPLQACGSSPRMRGTRGLVDQVERCDRFIPAHAGNAYGCSLSPVTRSVHPRACGERFRHAAHHPLLSGSSPRMRGTHDFLTIHRPDNRFIPAHAGNASCLCLHEALCAVHPRACGEREWAAAARQSTSGSSPRMRGTRKPENATTTRLRFIPAHAGNATRNTTTRLLVSVHPRACGERCCWHLPFRILYGSSPRMRGTLRTAIRWSGRFRFIPAHAGNAVHRLVLALGLSVHPRACGERVALSRSVRVCSGSSPRMRGTRMVGHRVGLSWRFIPAHAGNAQATLAVGLFCPVHPRACGERNWRLSTARAWYGSSPRMRGTPSASRFEPQKLRFIPAHAGNAYVGVLIIINFPVHPRACGERECYISAPPEFDGSSPRMRGTLAHAGDIPDCRRFIPAHAGNAKARLVYIVEPPVHPRACGERSSHNLLKILLFFSLWNSTNIFHASNC